MKKVMIGILVCIPVLILAIVGAVSAVVSTRTHIGVEQVLFDTENIKIEFGKTNYDLNDFINVTILPEKATDKSYEWFIEDLECLDESYEQDWKEYNINKDAENFDGVFVPSPAALIDANGNEVESNSNGKIKISSYCTFYATVKAESVSARCFVHIWSGNIESVSIKGVNSLRVGEKAMLNAVCNPVDTVIKGMSWRTDNENLMSVDQNGVITAKASGTANVYVYVQGETGFAESSAFNVTVGSGITAMGQSITVGASDISLSSIGLTAGEIVSPVNCTVGEDIITITDASQPASFITANGEVTIEVCAADDITIENSDIYAFDENKDDNYILSVGSSISFNVVYLDMLSSSEVISSEVNWTSSVPAVASVKEGGNVTGLKSGTTTITAEYRGKIATMKIAVEKKVSTLILNITDSALEVGLAKETVFASQKYAVADAGNKNKLNNSITIGFMLPVLPDDDTGFYDAFDFTVTENGEWTDKAYFEDNVLIFDSSKINGMSSLTVTVKAKYPLYESNDYATKSFTVKVVDGVSVGSFADMRKASAEKLNMVMTGNIRYQDDFSNSIKATGESIFVYKNLYGNGHMLWAGEGQIGKTSYMVRVCSSDSIVSNLWVRATQVGEEITNVEDNASLTGVCLVFGSATNNWAGEHLTNQAVEYSIIENTNIGMHVYGTELTINGCIIRNTSGTGIYTRSRVLGSNIEYSHITIRNCVSSNLVGMTFSFHYDGFTKTNETLAMQALAENKSCTLTQEGFLDIYNWQELNVVDLIPDGVLDEKTKQLLTGLVRNLVINSPIIDDVSTLYNGTKYFHLGFMSSGISDKSYLKATFEDERIKAVSSSELLASVPFEAPIFLFTYGKDSSVIGPGKTYSINKKMIERLHGVGVVENDNPTTFNAADYYS